MSESRVHLTRYNFLYFYARTKSIADGSTFANATHISQDFKQQVPGTSIERIIATTFCLAGYQYVVIHDLSNNCQVADTLLRSSNNLPVVGLSKYNPL